MFYVILIGSAIAYFGYKNPELCVEHFRKTKNKMMNMACHYMIKTRTNQQKLITINDFELDEY